MCATSNAVRRGMTLCWPSIHHKTDILLHNGLVNKIERHRESSDIGLNNDSEVKNERIFREPRSQLGSQDAACVTPIQWGSAARQGFDYSCFVRLTGRAAFDVVAVPSQHSSTPSSSSIKSNGKYLLLATKAWRWLCL